MRELNHSALIERPRVLGRVCGRCRRADDVRKPRTIGRTRNPAGPLAKELGQSRQPGKQTSLEYAAECSQTLFQEMHLVLDNEARERIEKDICTVRKSGRYTLIARWEGSADRRSAGHVQEA